MSHYYNYQKPLFFSDINFKKLEKLNEHFFTFQGNDILDIETDLWGVVDKTGKKIIPCKYDHITIFGTHFFKVGIINKYGVFNIYGEEILECKYDWIYQYKNNFFKVLLNDEQFWINHDGIKIKINELC